LSCMYVGQLSVTGVALAVACALDVIAPLMVNSAMPKTLAMKRLSTPRAARQHSALRPVKLPRNASCAGTTTFLLTTHTDPED